MKRSDKRILTTHAGSLLRPRALGDMLGRHSRHETVDAAAMEAAILDATRRVVKLQAECGIDIANNGEQARESFFTYVQHRMSGFGGQSDRPAFADMRAYPSFLELIMAQMRARVQVDLLHAPKAIGAVNYIDRAPLDRECDDFAKVLADLKPGFAETFMTAPSPGIIAAAMLNAHYPSLEHYVVALADALRVEYETIVARGFLLQIDAPDLGDGTPCDLRAAPARRILSASSIWSSPPSIARSRTFRPTRCGCMCVGATTRDRMITTWRSK